MKKQPEYELQKSVCRYLSIMHPNVLFMTDTIASIKLIQAQATRNKQVQKKGFKCPDLIVFEPRKGYNGLFIELKVKSPYKKDGTLYANEHLEGQEKTMTQLESKGYKCFFSWSYDMTIKIIDDYLK